MCSWIASDIRRSVSSRVDPVATQPGGSGRLRAARRAPPTHRRRPMIQVMRANHTATALLLAALSVAILPPLLRADTRGPASGTLFIVGGGLRDPTVVRQFMDLAGGPDAPIVIVPTAGDDDTYAQDYPGTQQFRDVGARKITVLHTRDRKVADTDAFVTPLKTARGVFFQGGRQWRLADSYLGTKTQQEVARVLERGGVVGGTSAGATILGSFLVRGDTKGNELMVGDHVEGFGLLTRSAIDQHLLRRNRQFDLIPVIAARPQLLGIGIDEDTAIVVKQTMFDVIGNGYVAIYDGQRGDPPGGFYLLAPGDRFDLTARKATRGPKRQPLDGVQRRAPFVPGNGPLSQGSGSVVIDGAHPAGAAG